MIVVDVNIMAYLWIPGDHTALAEEVLKTDPEWLAPLLWRSEFKSVLFGYMRVKKLSKSVALQAVDAAVEFMEGREYLVPAGRVLTLATKASRCSAYDCEYVALALERKLVFVSMDKKLVSAFPGTAALATEFVKS